MYAGESSRSCSGMMSEGSLSAELDSSLALGKPFGSINEALTQSLMLVEIVSKMLASSLDILQEAALGEVGMTVYLPVNANNRLRLLYPAAGSARNGGRSGQLLRAFRPRDSSVQVQSFTSGQLAFVDGALMLPIFHFDGTSAVLVEWSPLEHRLALAPALLRHLRVAISHSGLLELLASTSFIHPPEIYRMLLEDPLAENDKRWVLDAEAPDCFLCKVPFNLLLRRHHCRQCLKVVCGNCSAVGMTAGADMTEAPEFLKQLPQFAQQLAQLAKGWPFCNGQGLRRCCACAARQSLAAPAPLQATQAQLRGSAAALCERRKQLIGSKRRLSHETYRLQFEPSIAATKMPAATRKPPARAPRSPLRRVPFVASPPCRSSSEAALDLHSDKEKTSSPEDAPTYRTVALRSPTKLPEEMLPFAMPSIPINAMPPPLRSTAALSSSPPPLPPPLVAAPPPPPLPILASLWHCAPSTRSPLSSQNGRKKLSSTRPLGTAAVARECPKELTSPKEHGLLKELKSSMELELLAPRVLSRLSLHESIKAKPGLRKTALRRSTGGTPLKERAVLTSGGESLKLAIGQKLAALHSAAAGEEDEDLKTLRTAGEWT